MALSSIKTEYIAITVCASQAVWFKNLLEGLEFEQDISINFFCDNFSITKLSKNPVIHGRSKHIYVQYHFLYNHMKKVIELVHCKNEDQVADIFTKPLNIDAFIHLRGLLGVCKI